MKEFDTERQRVLAHYLRLAEKSANELGQPLGDVIKADFVNHLLPDLNKLEKAKIYSVETPYGNLTLDPKSRIATSPFLEEGATVDAASLRANGLFTKKTMKLKLLATGKLTKKLTVHVDSASEKAIAAVEKAGGKVIVSKLAPKKEKEVAKK